MRNFQQFVILMGEFWDRADVKECVYEESVFTGNPGGIKLPKEQVQLWCGGELKIEDLGPAYVHFGYDDGKVVIIIATPFHPPKPSPSAAAKASHLEKEISKIFHEHCETKSKFEFSQSKGLLHNTLSERVENIWCYCNRGSGTPEEFASILKQIVSIPPMPLSSEEQLDWNAIKNEFNSYVATTNLMDDEM